VSFLEKNFYEYPRSRQRSHNIAVDAQPQMVKSYSRLPALYRRVLIQVCVFANSSVLSARRFKRRIVMKRISVWGLVIILGTTFAAVTAWGGEKSDLAARAATWEKEYNADNLAGVVALYAADGCRLPPNQPAVCGRDAIMEQLKAGKDRGAAQVKIAVTSAERSGNLGTATGTYEITAADGSHVDHGKWMLIEKKVNGTWLTQKDIFNSDMAMPDMK
jgi:ketosteroid isomerase-like protein